MKLAVEVMDAYDLMPKDGQGSSNPFVEVDFDGQVHRTPTKFKDLNPSWNQTLLFNLSDPRSLPTQTLDVCVYHDSSSSSSSRRRHFLGRVRISGISIARSPDEAQLQRFPLEKRGFFSNIRGDLALRIYTLDNSQQTSTEDHLKPPPPPQEAQETTTKTTPNNIIEDQVAAAAAAAAPDATASRPPPQQQPQPQQQQQRVFFSVPAEDRRPPQPPQPADFRAVPMAAPPPQSAPMQVRPGMPMNIPIRPPQNDYGLIETAPPIAGRMGYRTMNKISSTYDLVEQMHFLYVNVVKARDLPTMDLTGSLDPYAEVKLGNYKGTTRYVDKNSHPVWRQTFAFSKERVQANFLEVAVKDKDLLKDDFVGRVVVNLTDVPLHLPPDGPLAPMWYWLMDKNGEKLPHGEIMLAIWIGTQADEAFPDAWHSDAHNLGLDGLSQTRSKVYFSPKLCYLRVQVIEAQDLVPHDRTRPPEVCVRLQVGNQVRATRVSQLRSVNPVWNEEYMFVASEPFDEPLIVTVEDRVGPSRSEPLGRARFPVSSAYPRTDHRKAVDPRWLDLSRPDLFEEVVGGERLESRKKDSSKFSSKIHLRICLETGYHVLDESTYYSSDLQPSNKHLRLPRVGLLELGILSARNLMPMKAKEGRTTDAYCVAKYGPKWVRTRTLLDTLTPRWNEQYTWEVFDPCTVITIAVFDNCHFTGHHHHNHDNNTKDQRIGKVRIRLSTLETERVYTHYYPLLVLQPSGLKKTGELHLAVRFTCTAWVNTMTLYGKPLLPKMHYVQPIAVMQLDILRHQAMQIVAARLARAEPPLRREVVEYMLDVDSHMWSLRRSKANFYRITSLLSGLGAILRWFDSVRNWRNAITTILVHALFLILVCYPELILPTVFLYLFMIGIWNYRYRPRKPPHMDTKLSYAEGVHPDELDEEFDTFPTSRPSDIVRMRYDRMRSVAGRVQTVVGDLATQGERVHALLSWRDPRATAIFIILALIWALVLYVTPFQVVVVLVGLYLLRHPRFRSRLPSVPYNFYRRLPAKSDGLL